MHLWNRKKKLKILFLHNPKAVIPSLGTASATLCSTAQAPFSVTTIYNMLGPLTGEKNTVSINS